MRSSLKRGRKRRIFIDNELIAGASGAGGGWGGAVSGVGPELLRRGSPQYHVGFEKLGSREEISLILKIKGATFLLPKTDEFGEKREEEEPDGFVVVKKAAKPAI